MESYSSHAEVDQRLSRIMTQWSMVHDAHEAEGGRQESARREILQSYLRPAYRYLLAAVRDPEVADELCNEFCVRCLSGRFRGADQTRGRFRDYIKSVLVNLVNDHFRTQKKVPGQYPGEWFEPQDQPMRTDGISLETCLKDELINRTWDELEQANVRYYHVLRSRVDEPDLTASEIAEKLRSNFNLDLSSDTVRKTLERARSKFANLLIDQAEKILEPDSPSRFRVELKELGLLGYCRNALERREKENASEAEQNRG